jgi:hypothetical protein
MTKGEQPERGAAHFLFQAGAEVLERGARLELLLFIPTAIHNNKPDC